MATMTRNGEGSAHRRAGDWLSQDRAMARKMAEGKVRARTLGDGRVALVLDPRKLDPTHHFAEVEAAAGAA